MAAVINNHDAVSTPHRPVRRKLLVLAFLILLVVSAAGLVLQRTSHPYDGRWELASADIDGMTIEPGLRLQIEGDTITGSAPCNDFSGQLGAEMFHALAGCVDHDGPAFPPGLEERFMSAIRGTIERHGDTLTFTSSDAKLTYQRVGDVADQINHCRQPGWMLTPMIGRCNDTVDGGQGTNTCLNSRAP